MGRCLFAAAILSSLANVLGAQSTDRLFALRNAAPGVFKYCSISTATGAYTDIALSSFTGVGSGFSSCVDPIGGRYFVSNGAEIHGIDVVSSVLLPAIVLPLATQTLFEQIVFDPCSGTFIGILHHFPSPTYTLSRFDPVTAAFSSIRSLPSTQYLDQTRPAEFDAQSGTYIVFANVIGDAGAELACIDTHNGDLLSAEAVDDMEGEAFLHWALACEAPGRRLGLIGTSLNYGQQIKYVGECDPFLPEVSHAIPPFTAQGFWKPIYGGSCLDQDENMFYWSAAGGIVVGASLNTSSYQYIVTSGDDLMFLEHMSGCPCSTSTDVGAERTLAPFSLVGAELILTSVERLESVDVYNTAGQLVLSIVEPGPNSAIRLDPHLTGLLIVRTRSHDGALFSTQRFIRLP